MQVISFDPVLVLLLLLASGLYVRALRILARRRLHVSRWQQAAWWIGTAVLAIGLLGPPDAYDDRLLSAHMAQHLLIGDVAAPLLLLGMRTPLLLFCLPRSALVLLARRRWLRRAFAAVRRPLVALPLYVATIYVWHWSPLFEGAIEHPLLHALQHEAFLVANLLLWWPVIEPQRRRMGGQLWKIGYIFAARMSTMFLAMMFVFARGVLYVDAYGRGTREGIAPRADQQTAGGLMMTLDVVVMLLAVCWFFWLASREHDATGAHTPERPRSEPPPRSRAAI
ncbi:MAG TPA: cytochrome c oxidase assembly protein [Conexibacter sp.]|nr:cytochrome c oxidase assembly protein [Conexibacter sp.]